MNNTISYFVKVGRLISKSEPCVKSSWPIHLTQIMDRSISLVILLTSFYWLLPQLISKICTIDRRDDLIDTPDSRRKDWCCCCVIDMKGPVYSTHKSRRGIIWAARRGAAGGCGRCGGSRVHAGSDLTLDSRAHVYAYTTPAAARRHRCLHALNTLNILHAHQLTERRRYPPTALPKNSQSRRVHVRRT